MLLHTVVHISDAIHQQKLTGCKQCGTVKIFLFGDKIRNICDGTVILIVDASLFIASGGEIGIVVPSQSITCGTGIWKLRVSLR